jgi:hypothetical protein
MGWAFYASYVAGWVLLIVYLLSLRSSLGREGQVWAAQPKWRRRALFLLTDLCFVAMISLLAAPFFASSMLWALSVSAGTSTFAAFFSGALTSALQNGWPFKQRHISSVFLPAAPLVGLAAVG